MTSADTDRLPVPYRPSGAPRIPPGLPTATQPARGDLMSDEAAVKLTDEEREALAEAVYRRKYAHARTAMTPWSGLTDWQREGEQSKWLNEAVERIVAARVASALAPIEALADEWATDGPSLVRHAYSGGDVHEGMTLERCATELRAALAQATATSEAAAGGGS